MSTSVDAHRLQRNAVGLAPTLFQSITHMAPAAAVAFSIIVGVPYAGGSISLAVLLAWQLAVGPLLLQTGRLDPVLVGAALQRLEPGAGHGSVSLTTAGLVIVVWTVLPLAAGAWRTQTRDA